MPHAIYGESSAILVQKLGIDPLPAFSNPVYGWIIGLLGVVTGPGMVLAAHLFSAVCGAALLAVLFMFMYRYVRLYNSEKLLSVPAMHRIQVIAGLTAVLYLLASPPFALAATRAHPLTFDLLILLTSFYLVMAAARENNMPRFMLATLLYGIAIVEFHTAILLAPVFGILLLVRLWQARALNVPNILKLLGAGLLGLSLYIIQAGLYRATPAYVWREFSGFFELLWYIWIDQYIGLTKSLPRVGWLTLGLVSVLPLLLSSVLRISRKTTGATGAIIGVMALNLVLAVLAVALMLDRFPLSPVNLTGTAMLYVTPYLLIAIWVASVTAFWLVVLTREHRFERKQIRDVRMATGRAVMVAVPVLLLGTVLFRTLPSLYDLSDKLTYDFASRVVDMAGDRQWLITSTPMDNQIAVEAHRRGLPLKMIRLAYGQSIPYMKYVASLFRDDPRLESMARIGMAPLIEEWFDRQDDIAEQALIVHVPDIWLASGYEAVPDRLVFKGAPAGRQTEASLDRLIEENRAFLDDFGVRVQAAATNGGKGGPVAAWIRNHMSKVANNLGVYLEDYDRTKDAYTFYEAAREIAPDNLSALMNLHVLSGRLGMPEHQDYEEELLKRTRDLIGRVQTWTLSYVYGYVRVPELFANRGMAFAMSGKANMAITDMKRALSLKENDQRMRVALGNLYFAQNRDTESREYYQGVLDTDPDNLEALTGMMRLSVRLGDLPEARIYLRRLRELGYDENALKLEEAVIESFDGVPVNAMKLLQDVVRDDPENSRAWAAIAITASQLRDQKSLEEALDRLRMTKDLSPDIQLVMAQSAIDAGEIETARNYLNGALQRNPGFVRALEMLLRISIFEGGQDEVYKVVERILRVEPSNAFANYMLGVHHYFNEEYELAESAYRRSLDSRRTPEALNDLAYILFIQNELVEASMLIRESLELNNDNSAAWDTYGVILMKQGKLEEAEKALQRSLTLRPGAATVMLSLARLYEQQERWKEAGEIALQISEKLNELPPLDQTAYSGLRQRLDDRGL